MRDTFLNVVAVVCGLILIAGVICILAIDATGLEPMVAIMGVLYVFYVVKLVQRRKKAAKKTEPPKGALRR